MEEYEAAKMDKRRGAKKQINGCSVRSDYTRRINSEKQDPTSITLHRFEYSQEKGSHVPATEGEDKFGFQVGTTLNVEVRSHWEIVDSVRALAKESQKAFQKNLLNPETDTLVVFMEHECDKKPKVTAEQYNALCRSDDDEDSCEGTIKVKMTRKGRQAEVVQTSEDKKEERLKKEKREIPTYKGRIDFYQHKKKEEIRANSQLRYECTCHSCNARFDIFLQGRANVRRELIKEAS